MKASRVVLAALAMAMAGQAAMAASVAFELDNVLPNISDSEPYPAALPKPKVTITDVGANTVELLFSMPDVPSTTTSDVKVQLWWLNLDDALFNGSGTLLNALTINPPIGAAATVTYGKDFNQADGDGLMDLKFDWGGNSLFVEGTTVKYTLAMTGLSVGSFLFESVPKQENQAEKSGFYSAAHVTGIPTSLYSLGSIFLGDGDGPEIIVTGEPPPPIPTPAAVLLALPLLGLAGVTRPRRAA